eukprot:3986365-Karenia_brevis.AAC.1
MLHKERDDRCHAADGHVPAFIAELEKVGKGNRVESTFGSALRVGQINAETLLKPGERVVLKNYMRRHKFHVLFVEEARSKKG